MDDLKDRLEKCVDAVKRNFATVRTGRANPQLLDRLMVDYYGSPVPIRQVASVTVPESMTLVLNVFDKSAVTNVEKAIQTSDLNLTPQVDNCLITLRIPPLTNDRRQELIKLVGRYTEDGKVAIRNTRRDEIDKLKTDKSISEDESKKYQDSIQKMIDVYIKELDQLAKDKEAEITKI